MLLNRHTINVKLGRAAELAELLKTGANHLDWIPPFRVMAARIGVQDRMALELEFESLADYDRFWSAFAAAPETQQVMARLLELTEPGTVNEIWEVV